MYVLQSVLFNGFRASITIVHKFKNPTKCTKNIVGFRLRFRIFCSKELRFIHHFRDLTLVRAEVNKSARSIQGACVNLERVQRGTESNVSAVLDRERENRAKV